MLKRLALFILLNCLIFVTVSVIFTLLCSFNLIAPASLTSLFVFCLLFGFSGAMINLFFSKLIVKKIFKMKILCIKTATLEEQDLIYRFKQLAKKCGLNEPPELAIFLSTTANAFATGATKKRSIVAISSNLFEQLSKEELDAVLAHELGHIKSGDMVTMTLLQGLVNTFVLFFSRILTTLILRTIHNDKKRSDQRSHFFIYYIIRSIFETVFMILGSILVAFYSRKREFRADAFSANNTSPGAMIKALKRLKDLSHTQRSHKKGDERIAALMIHSTKGFLALFATHPPLEQRIASLESLVETTKELNSLNV